MPDDMPASNIPGMTECTADSFLEPGLRKVWIFTGPENSVLTFQVGVHSREEEISGNDYSSFLKHSGKIAFLPSDNSSCGKVLFSQACVKNSVGGGGGSGVVWHYSGRYAPYWNAFLYSVCLHVNLANSSKFDIVSMVTGSLTGM